jgi:hypothetical protein
MSFLVEDPDVTQRHLQSVSHLVSSDVWLPYNPFRWDDAQYTFFSWDAIWKKSFIVNLLDFASTDTASMLVLEPDLVDYYREFGFTGLLRLESGFGYDVYIDSVERPRDHPADSILHRSNQICYYDNLPGSDPRFMIACDRSLELCVLGSSLHGLVDFFKRSAADTSNVMFFQKDDIRPLIRNSVLSSAVQEVQTIVDESF